MKLEENVFRQDEKGGVTFLSMFHRKLPIFPLRIPKEQPY